MSKRKTYATKASVPEFISQIENDTRRKDSKVVARLMRKASGKKATMWGSSIIGFGVHYYTLANGDEADICKIGFAPRKQALAFYLSSFKGKEALLKKLGKYKMSQAKGGGCMYISKLDDVDLDVLEEICSKAYQHNLQGEE